MEKAHAESLIEEMEALGFACTAEEKYTLELATQIASRLVPRPAGAHVHGVSAACRQQHHRADVWYLNSANTASLAPTRGATSVHARAKKKGGGAMGSTEHIKI